MPAYSKATAYGAFSLLVGLVGGGAVGAALWFAVDRTVQFNGQGWLSRWDWPIAGWAVCAAVGAVVGGVLRLRARQQTQLLSAKLAALQQQPRFTYVPAVTKKELNLADSAFPHWHRGEHWLRWNDGQAWLDMVDVTEVERQSDSSTTTQRTVFLADIAGVPEFELRPRRLWHRWLRAFGFGELSFDASQATCEHDRRAVERFVQYWHLATDDLALRDQRWPSASEREDAVRRWFTPSLMERLEPFRGWSVQSQHGRVIVWYGRGFAPADRRDALLRTAADFRHVLAAHAASGAPVEQSIPPCPGDTAYARVQRAIAVCGGGLAGVFLGFFTGGGAYLSLQFDRDRPVSIEAGLFFGLPLVGAALGGITGVLAGRSLSRFVKLPRSADDSRDAAVNEIRASSGCTVAGSMAGFVAGGALILTLLVAAHAVAGTRVLPPWLQFPLFFAVPIVGLVGGGIVGTRYGQRRAQRRQNK